MGKFKLITHMAVFATSIPFFIYPQVTFSQTHIRAQKVSSKKLHRNFSEKVRYHLVSYDDMINLLGEIESGVAEKKYREQDLEKINEYLAYLAQQGMLPNSLCAFSLREDIEDLLSDEPEYEFAFENEDLYSILPAVNHDQMDIFLCKSKLSKKWKKTKKFIKKHKKEIIIGAVIIVAVAAVVVAVVVVPATAAATAAAGAAGVATASKSDQSQSNNNGSQQNALSPIDINLIETPIFKAELDNQVMSFKEKLHAEEVFQNPDFSSPYEMLSWEETGRVLGPLFAHESLLEFQRKTSNNSQLAQEIQTIRVENSLPIENSMSNCDFSHKEIDRVFSTDYSTFFLDPNKEVDFDAISYHMRGEQALRFGHYLQAVNDLGRAIELDPTNSLLYLERSTSYFNLGQYDRSLEDFQDYISQTPTTYSLSLSEFGIGFGKGLPRGIYDSSEGILLLLNDLLSNPIHTANQMWEALTLLSTLAQSEEWGILGETLAPEVHRLITKWNTIPSNERGELAGYAFGKYGADILVPGAVAKVMSKGVRGARELSTVCRGLKRAEQTILLETVSGLESSAKIAEVVQLEKRISEWLGEGVQFIRNEAGDPIFLSKDGLRCARFDFNSTKPHNNPHAHLEIKVDGKWVKSGQIYPTDVPHD